MTVDEIARFAAAAPLTASYRFELLKRSEVSALIASLSEWYRDISVGAASCFLDKQFYGRKVLFEDATENECIVLAMKCGDELVGMFSCEMHFDTQSVYAGLGVAAPDHRGSRVAQAGMAFVETLGRYLGMGFVFGMATLKHPYAQRAFERAGWQLVGIMPGYDQELIPPGIVKRVYEAMYSKALEPERLLEPQAQNMTPRAREMFEALFAGGGGGSGRRGDPSLRS